MNIDARQSGIEIVSPAGNVCGTVNFAGATSVAVGRGGAVIGSAGPRGCSKIFWQSALR